MDKFSRAVERAKKAILDSFEFTALVDEAIDKYDLVEVVRCKECIHRHKADDYPPFKSGYYCDLFHIKSEMKNCDEWFCADGERRE